MNDMQPSIVKVGMIRKVETLNVLIDALTKYRPDHIIYAPSIWSSQGDALMTEDVVSQIKYRLLPLCSVVVARKKESDIILQNSRLLELAESRGSGSIASIMPIRMVSSTASLLPLPSI